MRRSNLLVVSGIAFFVIGVIIVALLSRDDGSSSAAPSGTVDVLVAKADIPAGTNGDDATTLVEVHRVPASDRQADALVTPSQLSNEIFTSKFAKNEQIRSGGLKVRSLTATVQVPAGKEAVPVALPYVNGGAGYLSPGDLVNVYEVVPSPVQGSAPFDQPRTQLLLTNVKILDVQQQVAALNTSTAAAQAGVAARPASSSNGMTVVLAVDPIDAEKVIFGSATDGVQLYLTKVADNATPAGPTPGRDFKNIFEESPDQANLRDHN